MNRTDSPPPGWPLRFLQRICPEHLYEVIEGDLLEQFYRDVNRYGLLKAKRKFLWSAICFCRPGILLRNKIDMSINQLPMLKNYFKTSFRHMLKSKVNFSFKLGGLILAMVSMLVIVLYVSFQLSFDKFHSDYQSIYRVNSEWVENGSKAKYAIVPPRIGPMLKELFPEVTTYARLTPVGTTTIRYKTEAHRVFGFTEADSTVFDILTFHFIRGDRQALNKPGFIILTETLAQQIFGNEDPMGKSILFADLNNKTFEVAAIIEDLPLNSHLEIKGLVPHDAFRDPAEPRDDEWQISVDGSNTLFLKLNGNTDPGAFEKRVLPHIRARLKKTEEGMEKEYCISLQAISDIYLSPSIYAEFNKKGNRIYVYVFSVLGIFLLAIASMNYINLSIADFHKRNKEIGVRKIMGARRNQIGIQVIAEAIFLCMMALLISLGLVYVFFPYVLSALEPSLKFSMLFDKDVLILVLIILAALVIFSTAYPAYRLAVNNPVDDLKGSSAGKGISLGSVLMLAQFSISVISICATYIVGQQLNFLETKNPGYDRANTLVLIMPDHYPDEKIPVIKEELSRLPGVEGVSYSTFRIAGAGYYRDWYRVEINGEMKRMMLNEVFFDHDFFRTMDIPIVAGRSFDPSNASDAHTAFIVNETAVKEFGWDDPIGKRISYGYEEAEGEKWEGTIVGVTKDFNVYSMHKKIEPLVMRLPWSSWPGQCVHVRIQGPLDPTIERIKKKYAEILPDFLIDYRLVADMYNNQYQQERKAYAALSTTMWIIVLIASLGIFSLSAFVSMRRMKEFGIRKVLGASGMQIAGLQLSHFVKIALVANVVALPIGYWMMRTWLEEFAYRVDVSPILFIVVAAVLFFIVVISAAYSSWKSSRVNPVEIIR